MDPVGPFVVGRALQHDNKVFDGTANWVAPHDLNNAGHRLTTSDAFIGKPDQRFAVMAQEDASFGRSPGEQIRVGHLGETNMPNPHDVQVRQTAQKPRHDLVVEVVICGQARHAYVVWR